MSLPRNEWHAQWPGLEARKDFATAILRYQMATGEYPDDAMLFVYLAHSYRMLGRHDEALPQYDVAWKLASSDRVVRDNVYYGYLGAAADAGFSKRDWTLAIDRYLHAIHIQPDYSVAYNLLGNALRNAGRVDESYAYYKRGFELNRVENTQSGLAANFRAGLSSGLRNGTDKPAWAALAMDAFGTERAFQLEVVGAMAAMPTADWGRVRSKLQGGLVATLMEGASALGAGETEEAYGAFAKASAASPEAEMDEFIARLYRAQIEKLPYDEQMSSPLQDRAVEFYTRAKDKYFASKPYRQTLVFLPPLRDEFCSSQTEGGRSFHLGLYGHYSYDLGACDSKDPTGMAVYAAAGGEVIDVVDNQPDQPRGGGVQLSANANWIRIRHADGSSAIYAHHRQGSALVRKGEQVKAGQRIAAIGNSGISSGPHLHFQVVNGENITLPVRFSQLRGRPLSAQGPLRPINVLSPHHRFRSETVEP